MIFTRFSLFIHPNHTIYNNLVSSYVVVAKSFDDDALLPLTHDHYTILYSKRLTIIERVFIRWCFVASNPRPLSKALEGILLTITELVSNCLFYFLILIFSITFSKFLLLFVSNISTRFKRFKKLILSIAFSSVTISRLNETLIQN